MTYNSADMLPDKEDAADDLLLNWKYQERNGSLIKTELLSTKWTASRVREVVDNLIATRDAYNKPTLKIIEAELRSMPNEQGKNFSNSKYDYGSDRLLSKAESHCHLKFFGDYSCLRDNPEKAMVIFRAYVKACQDNNYGIEESFIRREYDRLTRLIKAKRPPAPTQNERE